MYFIYPQVDITQNPFFCFWMQRTFATQFYQKCIKVCDSSTFVVMNPNIDYKQEKALNHSPVVKQNKMPKWA